MSNTIYHVAPSGHKGALLSLAKQHGESEAIEMYAERWPEAGELAFVHCLYVHCYDTLAEARDHVNDGTIYAIDVDAIEAEGYEVERDDLEFDHPVISGMVGAEYLTAVEEPTRRADNEI